MNLEDTWFITERSSVYDRFGFCLGISRILVEQMDLCTSRVCDRRGCEVWEQQGKRGRLSGGAQQGGGGTSRDQRKLLNRDKT